MGKYVDAAWLGLIPDDWGIIDLGQVYEERKADKEIIQKETQSYSYDGKSGKGQRRNIVF